MKRRLPGKPRDKPGKLDNTVRYLDSLAELVERVGMLFAVGLAIYVAVKMLFFVDDPAETRFAALLGLLNENWKAALLLVLPVIFRQTMMFLNSVTEITIGGNTIRRPPRRRVSPERADDPESVDKTGNDEE